LVEKYFVAVFIKCVRLAILQPAFHCLRKHPHHGGVQLCEISDKRHHFAEIVQ